MRIIRWTVLALLVLVGNTKAAEPGGVAANPYAATHVARKLPNDPVRALGVVVRVASTKDAYRAVATTSQPMNATPSQQSPTQSPIPTEGTVTKNPRFDPAVSQAAWISDESSAARPLAARASATHTDSSPATPRLLPLVPAAPLVGDAEVNPLRNSTPYPRREAVQDGSNPLR